MSLPFPHPTGLNPNSSPTHPFQQQANPNPHGMPSSGVPPHPVGAPSGFPSLPQPMQPTTGLQPTPSASAARPALPGLGAGPMAIPGLPQPVAGMPTLPMPGTQPSPAASVATAPTTTNSTQNVPARGLPSLPGLPSLGGNLPALPGILQRSPSTGSMPAASPAAGTVSSQPPAPLNTNQTPTHGGPSTVPTPTSGLPTPLPLQRPPSMSGALPSVPALPTAPGTGHSAAPTTPAGSLGTGLLPLPGLSGLPGMPALPGVPPMHVRQPSAASSTGAAPTTLQPSVSPLPNPPSASPLPNPPSASPAAPTLPTAPAALGALKSGLPTLPGFPSMPSPTLPIAPGANASAQPGQPQGHHPVPGPLQVPQPQQHGASMLSANLPTSPMPAASPMGALPHPASGFASFPPPMLPSSTMTGTPYPAPQHPHPQVLRPEGHQPAAPFPQPHPPSADQPLPHHPEALNSQPAPPQPETKPATKPKSSIDTSQLPRAVEAKTITSWGTGQMALPPPAGSEYISRDEGICLPRYIRSTLNVVPTTAAIVKKCNLCIGALFQPLASIVPEETEVPKVYLCQPSLDAIGAMLHGTPLGRKDAPSVIATPEEEASATGYGGSIAQTGGYFHEEAEAHAAAKAAGDPLPGINTPPRCAYCRAYVNPGFKFTKGGAEMICNLCFQTQEVPPCYRCALDSDGRRRDRYSRPELQFGSVDFVLKAKPLIHPAVNSSMLPGDSGSNTEGSAAALFGENPESKTQDVNDVSTPASVRAARAARALRTARARAEDMTLSTSPGPHAKAIVRDPCYLFVLDISALAIDTGLVGSAVEAIRQAIVELEKVPRARVGIMAYNHQVHFYSAAATTLSVAASARFGTDSARVPGGARSEPCVSVVANVNEPFLPVPASQVLVRLCDPKQVELLRKSLNYIAATHVHKTADYAKQSAFGAATQLAIDVMQKTGGKIIMFQTQLPTVGVGALQSREVLAHYATPKEQELYIPQTDFYQKLASQAASNAISVDLFNCAYTYTDLASIVPLVSTTGGQLYRYPDFNALQDGQALRGDIMRNITRPTVFDAVLTVRVSQGLKVAEYYGNWFQQRSTDVSLATMDCDKAFAVRFEHTDKLPDNRHVTIQLAMQFTTMFGERITRVHTLTRPSGSDLLQIYRSADMDVIVNLSLKQAVRDLFSPHSCSETHKQLAAACAASLAVYRKYCVTDCAPSQLILPESLRILPLCTLGIIKNPVLREGLLVDDRVASFPGIASMPAPVSVPFVAPRFFSIFKLQTTTLPNGRMLIPDSLQLSNSSLDGNDIFMLDDTKCIYIWVGSEVDPSLVSQLFQEEDAPPEPTLPSSARRPQRPLPPPQPNPNLPFQNLAAANPAAQSLMGTGMGPGFAPQTKDKILVLRDIPDPEGADIDVGDEALEYLKRIHAMIDVLRKNRPFYQTVHVIRSQLNIPSLKSRNFPTSDAYMVQRSKDEVRFFSKLIEDECDPPKLPNGQAISPAPPKAGAAVDPLDRPACQLSYVNFLRWIHRRIWMIMEH